MDNCKDDSRESKKSVASDKTQEKSDNEPGEIKPNCKDSGGNCPPPPREKAVVKQQGEAESDGCKPVLGNCPPEKPVTSDKTQEKSDKEERNFEAGCEGSSGNCPPEKPVTSDKTQEKSDKEEGNFEAGCEDSSGNCP